MSVALRGATVRGERGDMHQATTAAAPVKAIPERKSRLVFFILFPSDQHPASATKKALGPCPKKTPFSSTISFISENFPFFNTKTPSADIATRAVGWTAGLPMIRTGSTRFTGLRDRMLS